MSGTTHLGDFYVRERIIKKKTTQGLNTYKNVVVDDTVNPGEVREQCVIDGCLQTIRIFRLQIRVQVLNQLIIELQGIWRNHPCFDWSEKKRQNRKTREVTDPRHVRPLRIPRAQVGQSREEKKREGYEVYGFNKGTSSNESGHLVLFVLT